MPRMSLTPAERRARDRRMLLEALRGENRSGVAARHGVSEAYLYRKLAEARREAREESAFWREVERLVS